MLKKIAGYFYISYLRKKQRLHEMQIQKPIFIHHTATFNFRENIKIGKYCRIGDQCHLDGEGGIEIGNGSILAPKVVILSSSHDYKKSELLPYGIEDKKIAVVIGSGCWIGWGAMICPGVIIGDGAVVAMGSVVTKNVGTGQVVGGNPAKVINERNADINIAEMVSAEKFFLKEVLEKNLVREGRKTRIKDNLIE